MGTIGGIGAAAVRVYGVDGGIKGLLYLPRQLLNLLHNIHLSLHLIAQAWIPHRVLFS